MLELGQAAPRRAPTSCSQSVTEEWDGWGLQIRSIYPICSFDLEGPWGSEKEDRMCPRVTLQISDQDLGQPEKRTLLPSPPPPFLNE